MTQIYTRKSIHKLTITWDREVTAGSNMPIWGNPLFTINIHFNKDHTVATDSIVLHTLDWRIVYNAQHKMEK
jgi:hypothetical protein